MIKLIGRVARSTTSIETAKGNEVIVELLETLSVNPEL